MMTVGTYLGVGTSYEVDVDYRGHTYVCRLTRRSGPSETTVAYAETADSATFVKTQRDYAERMVRLALAEVEAEHT